MNVLIPGGSGLIGSQLSEELIKNGHQVTILSRSGKKGKDLPQSTEVAKWDGKTVQDWGQLIDSTDAIVNLAGENIAGNSFFPDKWTEQRKKIILSSRLEAGTALVNAIRQASKKPKVLIQSSAIGYYGPLDDELADENHSRGSDFMSQTCEAWENSTSAVVGMGIRHVVIRSGVVLSENGGAFTRLLLPFKLFVGGPLGDGKQYLSWIHIADQVGAIRFLIENSDLEGTFNLTAPEPVTNREFSQIMGKVLKRPSFLPLPGFIFRIAFGEVSTVVLDGQRVLPKRLLHAGYSFRYSRAVDAIMELVGK